MMVSKADLSRFCATSAAHDTFMTHTHVQKFTTSRSHTESLPALSLSFCLSVHISSASLSLCFTCLGYTVSPVTLEAFVPCCLNVCLKGSAVFLLSLLHSCLTCQKFLQYVWTFCQVTISVHYFHCDLDLSCDISFDTHEFKQLRHFLI